MKQLAIILALVYGVLVDMSRGFSLAPCSKADGQTYLLNSTLGQLRGSCQFVRVNEANPTVMRDGNVYSWLSVPYAEAPTGRNRFMRPQEKQPWEESRDATQPPPSCIQENTMRNSSFAGINMWKSPGPFSEDCLYLNIWTPAIAYHRKAIPAADPSEKTPILVFFHGSSAYQSSSNLDLYDPSTFVAATNIIVITVNYRLGVLGFLYLEGVYPGNQALYDQQEALAWIKNNAERFGGDPNRITISGHGSGAALAGYHLFIEKSYSLFRNVIMQSGTPLLPSLAPIRATEASTRANQLLSRMGCRVYIVECVEAIADIEQLLQMAFNLFQLSIKNDFVTEIYLKSFFPPVLDNQLIVEAPEVLLKRGHFKQCPILTGFTAHEGSFYIGLGLGQMGVTKLTDLKLAELTSFIKRYFAYSPNYPSLNSELFFHLVTHEYTKQTEGSEHLNLPAELTNKISYFRQLTKIIGDQGFVCPAYKIGDMFAKFNNQVYMYLYSHRISTTPWPRDYGAVHGDDLALTFAYPLAENRDNNATSNPWASPDAVYFKNEKLLASEMIEYWANFVRFDNPNEPTNAVNQWPQYKAASGSAQEQLNAQYIVFRSTGNRPSRGFSLESCILWNSYLPKIIAEHGEFVLNFLW